MSKVSVVRSRDKPTDEEVYGLVKESIDLLGGIEKYVIIKIKIFSIVKITKKGLAKLLHI